MDNEISDFLEHALDRIKQEKEPYVQSGCWEDQIIHTAWSSKIELLEDLIYEAKHM